MKKAKITRQTEKEAENLFTFLRDNWFLLAIGFLTCFVWFCICYTIASFITI